MAIFNPQGTYNPQQTGGYLLQAAPNSGLRVQSAPTNSAQFLQPTANPYGATFASAGGGGGSSTPSGNYSGGGGSSAPVIDYGQIAQADQQLGFLQSAIDRLPTQLNSGYSTIDASWQNALNQLLLGKNQAEGDYNTGKKTAADNFITAKNSIGVNAGQALSGILRLLGSRGAGGSSTAKLSAPTGVAQQATLQRNDVTKTNGQNNQSLDSTWNKYLLGYNNEVNSANTQRTNARKTLENSIDANRANLLQTMAQLSGQRAALAGGDPTASAAPYLAQANQALDRTANYATAPITYNTQAYTAPSLDKYTFDVGPAPTVQGSGTTTDYVSPYFAALLGGNRKQQPVGA